MNAKGKRQLIIIIITILIVLSAGLVIDNSVNKQNSIISKITSNNNNNSSEMSQNLDKNSQENTNSGDVSSSKQDKNNSTNNDSNTSKSNNSNNSKDENVQHVSSNPKGENGSYNFNTDKKAKSISSKKLPYKLPDKEGLVVNKIGQYSGQFLESGKDENVENTFAIIVKNKSKDMLQYGQLRFNVGGEDATFVVTNLSAGKSALVLEANKKSFSKTSDITYEGASTSYIDNNTMNKDKFKVTANNTKLKLKNLTGNKYSTVYVYYKNVDDDGSYLGGITYRTKFENVGANSTVSCDTEHYLEGASQIVMVDYIK